MATIIETIANKIESIVVVTATDHKNKIAVYYLMTAVVVYGLWTGVGFFMPNFYYDQPQERLLLTFAGFLLVVYLLSSRGPSTRKNSMILFLYVLVLHFHFLSLFVRAGGDEIYALGLLIFLIGASLLFLELRHNIGYFIIVIASYVPTFIALNLPSHRIVMLVAGMLTICVATSSMAFLRILMFDRFHTQQMAIADLERKLTEEKLLQQKKEAQHYKNVAYYDSLTGLPSRRSFDKYLQHKYDLANQKKMPFALLFADLDNFKEINDTYGHDAGDFVLQQFAERFKAALRSSDYPARYAGDEFVCILTEITDISDAKPICDRILKTTAKPYRLKPGITFTVAVSIGIALHPGGNTEKHPPLINSPQELLKYADRAMYEAKRRGKNRWVPYEQQAQASVLNEG